MDVVQVNIKNDDSVQKLIDKTAQKLQNKYTKKRKINEKLLSKKARWMDVISRILSVICVIVVGFSALLFVGIVNSLIQGVPSSFAGFTSMKVGSGSMVASGFNKGDNVIAKSVDTKTLKEEDIIAFYRYWKISNTFDTSKAEEWVVDTTNIGEPQYKLTFAGFFGTRNDIIREASNANCDIIFHKIHKVYEDENGVRWFQTYGSSNFLDAEKTQQQIDDWYVREDLVVGIYDDSVVANCIAGVLQTFSSSQGVVLALVIPLVLVGAIILLQFLRDIQVLKLQLDVVEEKRKITDPICTKYEIGYRMDNKMKYKVLAQASDKDKNEYIALLWKEGKAPENIRKYCLRKKMYLKPVEKLLEINRVCQERLKNGEDPSEVAKYYLEEKKALQADQLVFERKYRKWVKEDKIDWVSDEELDYDDVVDELNVDGPEKIIKLPNQEEQIVVEIDASESENEVANSANESAPQDVTKVSDKAKKVATKKATSKGKKSQATHKPAKKATSKDGVKTKETNQSSKSLSEKTATKGEKSKKNSGSSKKKSVQSKSTKKVSNKDSAKTDEGSLKLEFDKTNA